MMHEFERILAAAPVTLQVTAACF
ncbi:MAG: hypothetical protein QOG80_1008, partial [Pseudonocardiales bacterium]|nr:hypothetical protein [Pseudonocardiales bacterium]